MRMSFVCGGAGLVRKHQWLHGLQYAAAILRLGAHCRLQGRRECGRHQVPSHCWRVRRESRQSTGVHLFSQDQEWRVYEMRTLKVNFLAKYRPNPVSISGKNNRHSSIAACRGNGVPDPETSTLSDAIKNFDCTMLHGCRDRVLHLWRAWASSSAALKAESIRVWFKRGHGEALLHPIPCHLHMPSYS